MKKAIFVIVSAINALALNAGSLSGESGIVPERRDTLHIIDTVWLDPVPNENAADVPQSVSVPKESGEEELHLYDTFSRGIGKATSVFIPKGTFAFGLTASYNSYDFGTASDDVGYQMLFSLLNGIRGEMTSFGVSPHIAYFFSNNTSVGLRFDYAKSSLGLGNANIALGEVMTLGIQNMNYLKQSYSGSVTLRHYMSIADSKRFAIFIEGRGTLGYAQSQTYKMDGEDKFGTYQDIYNASLSLVPGVVCFMADNAAFEVSIGVLGLDLQKVDQITNQVEVSQMKSSGANFKINLLSINFGMSFYIYPSRKRQA